MKITDKKLIDMGFTYEATAEYFFYYKDRDKLSFTIRGNFKGMEIDLGGELYITLKDWSRFHFITNNPYTIAIYRGSNLKLGDLNRLIKIMFKYGNYLHIQK